MGLQERFKNHLNSLEDYKTALGIARSCASGELWLVGGGVYRNLANLVHQSDVPVTDYDFLVEALDLSNIQSSEVESVLSYNRFGEPRFILDSFRIDVFPFSRYRPFTTLQTDPRIDAHLLRAPLSVQAVAFNVTGQFLVGNIGINSILDKAVWVNCYEELMGYCDQVGITKEQYIEEKAAALGFKTLVC